MTLRKRKATFYLPEDLLRAARVHAARTDRRDSQVVEEALRSYLGLGAQPGVWELDEGAPRPGASRAAVTAPPALPEQAPDEREPRAPAVSLSATTDEAESDGPTSTGPEAPTEVSTVDEPREIVPLEADEALELALLELHALREEARAGGS